MILYQTVARLMAFYGSRLSLEAEEGQTLAEYALILALIAIAVVAAVIFLGGQISALFSSIGNDL